MGSLRDRVVTNTADIGAGAAFSILIAATASPLALTLAGVGLLAFLCGWSLQGHKDDVQNEAEAERQFETLVREAGSVGNALQRIADGQANSQLFLAAKAQEVLKFLAEMKIDQSQAIRDHAELTVYIGSKIESYFEAMGVVSQARHIELSEAAGRVERLLLDLSEVRTVRLSDLDRYESLYREWLSRMTGTLLVPGLGVELSITDSSATLRVMAAAKEDGSDSATGATLAAELRRYKEWASRDERHDSNGIDAIHLREYGEQLVVVGGPGSGKSTLARRVAHIATGDDLVLLARLKDVAKLLPLGSFAEAVATAAFDNSGVPAHVRHQLLEKAACIILDGLDETGGRRSAVSEHIRAWREGHKACEVIVLTRPVGHDPSLLPGWKHIELKKLSADEARSAAKRMIAAIAPNNPERVESVDRALGEAITQNAAVSIAARNPLLLGFVVHRLSEGDTLPSRRVDLFDLVIRRLATIPNDRDVPAADGVVLRRCLEAVGWVILSNLDAEKDEVINAVAQHYDPSSSSPGFDSIGRAEKSIELWEQRRVLETLCIRDEQAISFVHPALGEYAAACYAARLSGPEYSTWVEGSRSQPHWREALLMSAAIGRCDECVEVLLSLDVQDDQAAIEAALAAACVVENQGANPKTLERLLDHLARRLSSASRLICDEAADALWSLSPFARSQLADLVKGLQEHEQLWTRRRAFALAAASDPKSVRMDLAGEHIQWLISGMDSELDSDWFHRTNRRLRASALKAFLPIVAESDDKEMIQTVVKAWDEGRLSMEESQSVYELLVKVGAVPAGAEASYGKRLRETFLGRSLPNRSSWHEEAREILVAMVSAATRLGAQEHHAASCQPPMRNVARVIAALNYWKLTLRQSCNIDASDPSAVAMIAATIAATDCDPASVAAEATALLDAGDDVFSAITSDKVPQLPAVADWTKAPAWTSAPEFLLKAVTHESLVLSWPAANLIVDRVQDADLRKSIVKEALAKCDSEEAMTVLALVLKELGPAVSTQLAIDRLTERLDSSTGPLISLFASLPAESHEAEANQMLERALLSDINNAIAASAVLAKNSALDVPPSKMKDALTFWRSHEAPAPETGIIPRSPRASLVAAISRRNAWTLDELAEFSQDSRTDVRDAYFAACVEFARHSLSAARDIFSHVQQGLISHRVLSEIPHQAPGLIRDVVPEVEQCLRHDDEKVRLAALRLLTNFGELASKATSYAEDALRDTDVSVRDEAVRILRRFPDLNSRRSR